ncbi:hypothetical protein Btru_030082 [Bulinus truncatus]|nr:hypothetical protein Btru_030082 [Bulinus truncatus]
MSLTSISLAANSNFDILSTTPNYKLELISDEMTWLIMKILMFGITPIISVFGVIDITFLVSFNSVPKIVYEAVWNHEYVGYSKSSCDVLFIFFTLFTLLDYTFGLMGLTLPMLITAERLVVIFLPLNFDRIITPVRTWLALVGVAVYWSSIFLYSSFWQVLHYELDPITNTSMGIIKRSDFFNDNPESVAAIQDVIIYSSMVVPPLFTVTGCVVISVKLQITSLKRKKMTSKTRSNNRTTKTLLGVCAVYCVTAAVLSLPLYIPEYASYSLTDESPSNVGKLFYQLVNTVVCVNSSSNFVVYVALNKNFRDTLKLLFDTTCCKDVLHKLRIKSRERTE